MAFQNIAVLGAGAWGSALANVAARAGGNVILWARDADKAAAINRYRESTRLPGVKLHAGVTITAALAPALNADAILLAVPAQALRSVAALIDGHVGAQTPLIAC